MTERLTAHEKVSPDAEKPALGKIIACIGERASYKKEFKEISEDLEATPVDWYGSTGSFDALDQKHPGRPYGYVISAVDDTSKVSRGYGNCTGVAVVGYDPVAKTNISFLSHQNPAYFLRTGRERFEGHIVESLKEFLAQVEPGSVDAVIFAGNWHGEKKLAEMPDDLRTAIQNSVPNWDDMATNRKSNYRDAVQLLGRNIQEILGVEPEVIVGPNMETHEDGLVDVLLDTVHRRLYMLRAAQSTDSHDASFKPSEIDAQPFTKE